MNKIGYFDAGVITPEEIYNVIKSLIAMNFMRNNTRKILIFRVFIFNYNDFDP